MTVTDKLHDVQLEELVVSQCIRSWKFTELISTANRLRPHHFYSKHCEKIYETLQGLPESADRSTSSISLELTRVTGIPLDESREIVSRIANISTSPLDADALSGDSAERIKTLYTWRRRSSAAEMIEEAALTFDSELMSQALRYLDDAGESSSYSSLTAQEWGALMFEWMSSPEDEAFSTPFFELNSAMSGGLRRGELTVIGGYTSHGKSVLIDQLIDHIVEEHENVRCHLYLSEMTFIERGQRLISRKLKVPLRAVRERNLTESQKEQAVELFKHMSYGVSLVSGWSIDELAFDIKRCEWDVCAVDLIHGFEYSDTYGLEHIMRQLMFAAKGNGRNKGTAVIATSHLNDVQINSDSGKARANPKPTVRNLKGSSAIKQYADNILFIWREADEYNQLLKTGKLWSAKARQSELMYPLDVKLDTKSMRFTR